MLSFLSDHAYFFQKGEERKEEELQVLDFIPLISFQIWSFCGKNIKRKIQQYIKEL